MTPYDTYRLYQVERAKSPREIQRRRAGGPARISRVIAVPWHHARRAQAIPRSRARQCIPPGRTGQPPGNDSQGDGELRRHLLIHRRDETAGPSPSMTTTPRRARRLAASGT